MISLPYFNHQQSDSLLQAILSSSREAVVVECGRRVVFLNTRFLELAGWEGVYEGQSLDELIAVWSDRVAYPQTLQTYFARCRAEPVSRDPQEIQPNPGQVIDARHLVLPAADGEVLQLWYFQEWRTSALAWVSHEIKNPLNAVLGFSELLAEGLKGVEVPASVKESLRGLRVGAKNLHSVLGDVLTLSRLESGVVESRPEWTAIGPFLEDLNDLFQTRFRRRGVDFQVQGPQQFDGELWVDQGRLSQILSNLLVNALRFTKKGSVSLRVSQRGEAWEFLVEDSGMGIPADQQRTIFEPFVQKQGQDVQRFGGTGLGLAICRTLAQSLGGRISLESHPGVGSRFFVTFDHLQTRPSMKVQPDRFPSLPPAVLLVADDEFSNHLLIRSFLRDTAITVLSAYDGSQAVELWRRNSPDLALLDLRMPGQSGLETARTIQTLDLEGHTRLLAMSAASPETETGTEAVSPWVGYLEKPFQKGEFLKFLANHLTNVDESASTP